MNRDTIKQLNGDAARLLLVLLTCDGTETLKDLPDLIALAGLTTRGKNRYARAFQQLKDLHFVEIRGLSICVLFDPEGKTRKPSFNPEEVLDRYTDLWLRNKWCTRDADARKHQEEALCSLCDQAEMHGFKFVHRDGVISLEPLTSEELVREISHRESIIADTSANPGRYTQAGLTPESVRAYCEERVHTARLHLQNREGKNGDAPQNKTDSSIREVL